MRSHLLPSEGLLLRKRMTADAGEDAEEREFLSSTGRMYISTGTAAMIMHAPQILKTEVPPGTVMPALEMHQHSALIPAHPPMLAAGPFAIASTESA